MTNHIKKVWNFIKCSWFFRNFANCFKKGKIATLPVTTTAEKMLGLENLLGKLMMLMVFTF
jgi:hypothetical protein